MLLTRSFAAGRKSRLAIVACVALLLVAVKLAGVFDAVDRSTFDLMSTIAPPRPEQPAAVIVAIDEPSFSAVGKPWPWPRDLHAHLIRSLRQAGARTIGFDVVFADETQAEADAALAAAADPRTVFGVDETTADTPQGSMLVRTEPLPLLTANGALAGVTSVHADPDGVVRRIPRYPDSFARKFLTQPDRSGPENRLIQYFGGARTYPYISYYQALDPVKFLPPDMLKGRDVIVGLALQASPDTRAADAFETPFTARSGELVPGVEIQATLIDNLRHRLWLVPAAGWVAILLLFGGSALGYSVAAPERLPARLAATLGAAAAMLLAAGLVLRFGRLWISPVEPVSALVAAAAFLGIADFAAERRRRRGIQNAFGQYVAPEIVRRIVDDPDQVKLGGERKTITVLFADVRGFTTISESLREEPETLTRLMNQILTCLSDVVTKHCGTIDKYIGDCVMAFWNAPLDDADHAVHAVEAAAEIVERIAALNRSLRTSEDTADVSIAVGIGVNSGECVVGNMGSDTRFDYTVIGDAVNVASRIEGLSKDYDVPLLIGEETVALTGGRFDYVEIDKVRVRGKSAFQLVYSLRHLISSPAAIAGGSGGVDGASQVQ